MEERDHGNWDMETRVEREGMRVIRGERLGRDWAEGG